MSAKIRIDPPLAPFYAKMFADKLEHLTRAQRGVGCITRTISEMQIEKNWGDNLPTWWTDYVVGGLLDAIGELCDSAHVHLEFLSELVREDDTDARTTPSPLKD